MRGKLFLGAAAGLLLVQPALADVKAGVDAWARGDFRRAVEEWRGAAVAGDADAQFNMGQAYKLGRGVTADLAQAEEWYRKAAAQGHPQAIDNYGLALFQNGRRPQAVEWLERSAGRGEPRTQFVLGTMLFNGDVVGKDWVRAYALMTRASSSGLPQASQTLAQMDQYISLQDRQRGLAMAKTLEAQASRAPVGNNVEVATPAAPPRAVATKPASATPATPSPAARPTPRPAPVATAPAPKSAPVATAPAAKARDGGWRLQLGAFRDDGNARGLWSQVRGKFPGRSPEFVKAGTVTKVLVGPYTSSGEATRACAAVKPCLAVKR